MKLEKGDGVTCNGEGMRFVFNRQCPLGGSRRFFPSHKTQVAGSARCCCDRAESFGREQRAAMAT